MLDPPTSSRFEPMSAPISFDPPGTSSAAFCCGPQLKQCDSDTPARAPGGAYLPVAVDDATEQISRLRTELGEQRRWLLALETELKETQAQNAELEGNKCPEVKPHRSAKREERTPKEPEHIADTASLRGSPMAIRTSNQVIGVKSSPTGAISRVLPLPGRPSNPGSSQDLAGHSKQNLFDKDLLKAIYDKPYEKARRKGAMIGGGILGIMSMPFGPIGMVAGGTFGAMMGSVVGIYVDRRTSRKQLMENEVQKRRLKSLVRWALDHRHQDDEFIKVIEMVTLEFKPIADIAGHSKQAKKTLKLLDGWIAQRKVTRNLWVYMDTLLRRWREMNRSDFLRSMSVFQTLRTMYEHSLRVLDEQEAQFLERIDLLLAHESVKLVMAHAQAYPTEPETRLMECMVYADRRGHKKQRRPSGTSGSKPLHDEASDGGRRSLGGSGDGSPVQGWAHDDLSDESDEESPGQIFRTPSRSSFGSKDLHSHNGSDIEQGKDGEVTTLATEKRQRVLKRPFFKDFNDFMDFDNSFKHKMPITASEFDLLKYKRDESLEGWDVCVDRKEIKVAKLQSGSGGGVGGMTLRAWATIPDVDIGVAFYLFANHTERVKWDNVFAKMSIVEKDVQGSEVLYSILSPPPFVTARDFLQYRRCKFCEDGTILIMLRSAEHPDMPEQKGAIRAESFIAGYALHQTFNGTQPILNLFLMTCLDIKGLIPKWIINAVAPKKPAEWVESLKKAAVDYQKAHPNFKQELKETLNEYNTENPFDYEDEDGAAQDQTP